ncbi:D-dopachrome decarboxylase [Orchesella cincta]|uniref:D-dopachrome decarboxylase n=1 Tax=Orchesella cincta TaxID=48709 RepID=A0A1D2M7E6_ORCCI|nr:D-dopachrome decarboxylase [Orchesella cincta]
MPVLRIHTNVARSKIPATLPKELCEAIAKSLGRGVDSCNCVINHLVSWGGELSHVKVGFVGIWWPGS